MKNQNFNLINFIHLVDSILRIIETNAFESTEFKLLNKVNLFSVYSEKIFTMSALIFSTPLLSYLNHLKRLSLTLN